MNRVGVKDLKVALNYYSKLQNNDLFDVKDDIDRIKAAQIIDYKTFLTKSLVDIET